MSMQGSRSSIGPQSSMRANHEVGLLVSGAACHWVLTGYACEAAAALWARAEALLDGVTDHRLLILALMGINICAYAGADTRKALATAERLVSLGQATSDTDSKVVAFAAVGPTLYQQGQYERCKRLLEFVVETYETDRRTGYGRLNDAKVTACSWLSWIHLTTGRLDQARHYARMAIDHATAMAQPFVLSQALSVGARPFAEAGDCEEALELCRRCIELCDAQNLPFWKGWAMVYEGVAQMRLGQHERCAKSVLRRRSRIWWPAEGAATWAICTRGGCSRLRTSAASTKPDATTKSAAPTAWKPANCSR